MADPSGEFLRGIAADAIAALKRSDVKEAEGHLRALFALRAGHNALVGTSATNDILDKLIGEVVASTRSWRIHLELKRKRRGNPTTYEPKRKALSRIHTEMYHAEIAHCVFRIEVKKLNEGIEKLRRGEKISNRAILDRKQTYKTVAAMFKPNYRVYWETVRRIHQKARRRW